MAAFAGTRMTPDEEADFQELNCVLHLNLATAYLKQNNYSRAKTCASAAWSIDPTNAKAALRLAQAMAGEGDIAGAQSVLARVLKEGGGAMPQPVRTAIKDEQKALASRAASAAAASKATGASSSAGSSGASATSVPPSASSAAAPSSVAATGGGDAASAAKVPAAGGSGDHHGDAAAEEAALPPASAFASMSLT